MDKKEKNESLNSEESQNCEQGKSFALYLKLVLSFIKELFAIIKNESKGTIFSACGLLICVWLLLPF